MNCAITPEAYRALQEVILKYLMELERTGVPFTDDELKKIMLGIHDTMNTVFEDEIQGLYYASLVPEALINYSRASKRIQKQISGADFLNKLEKDFDGDTELNAVREYLFPTEETENGEEFDPNKEPIEPEPEKKTQRKRYKPDALVKNTGDNKYYRVESDRGDQVMLKDGKKLLPVAPGQLIPSGLVTIRATIVEGTTPGVTAYNYTVPAKKIKKGMFISLPARGEKKTFHVVEVLDTVYDYLDNGKVTNESTKQPITVVEEVEILPKIKLVETPVDEVSITHYRNIDDRYYPEFLRLLSQEERDRILEKRITLRQWLEDPEAPGIRQLPKNPGKNFNPVLVFENFLDRAIRNGVDARINIKNINKSNIESSIAKQISLLLQDELLAADPTYTPQQIAEIIKIWKNRSEDKSFTTAPPFTERIREVLLAVWNQVVDKLATGDKSGKTSGHDTLSIQVETGAAALFDIEGTAFKAISPSLTSTTMTEAPWGEKAIERGDNRVQTEALKFFTAVQRAVMLNFRRQFSKGNISDKYSFDGVEGIYLTAMNLESITNLSVRDREVLAGAKGAVMVITDKDGVPLRFSETDPNKLDPNGRIAYYQMHKLKEYGDKGKFNSYTRKSDSKLKSRQSFDKVDTKEAVKRLEQEYDLMFRVQELLANTPDAKVPFLITGGSPGYIALNYYTNTLFSKVTEKVQMKIEKPIRKNSKDVADHSGRAFVLTTESTGTGQWIELERPDAINTPYFDTIISLMTDPVYESDRETPISIGTRLEQLGKFIYINGKVSKTEDYLIDKTVAIKYDKKDQSKSEFTLVIGGVPYDVLNDPAAREKAVALLNEKAHRSKDFGIIKDYTAYGFEVSNKPQPGMIFYKVVEEKGPDPQPMLQKGEFKISPNKTYLNKSIKLPEITTLEDGTKVYSESATAMNYVDFMKEAGFRVNTPDVASDGTLKRLNPFFTFQAGDAAKAALEMNVSAEKQEQINEEDVKAADAQDPVKEEVISKEPTEKTTKPEGHASRMFGNTKKGHHFERNYIQKSNNPKATAAQIERARIWYEKHPMSSLVPFEAFFDLMNSTNPNAIAQWTHDGIILYEGADYSDLYHEAWHGFSQLFLTLQMKKDLYAEVRRRKGTFKDHEDQFIFFDDATDLQIEEFLAEEFRKYMLNGHTVMKETPHQNAFFKLILDILEFFFGDGNTFSVTQDVEGNSKVLEMFNKLKVGNISEFNFNHDNAQFTILGAGIKATPEHTAEEQTEELFINELGKEDSYQIRNMVDNFLAEFMMSENANLSDTELSRVYELKTYLALNETKAVGEVITDSKGNRVGTKAEIEVEVAALMTAKSHVYTGQLGKNNELLKKGYNKVYERFVKLYRATADAMAAEEDPIRKGELEKEYRLLRFAVKSFGNRNNIGRNRVKTGAPITGVIGYHLYHSELFFDEKMIAEIEDPDEVDKGKNLSMEGYERKGNETSIKDHLGPEITFLLQTLPEFKDGKPVYGRFQTMKLASLNLTINKIIRRAQNKVYFDDFFTALEQLGREYPAISVLLDRLPNPYGPLSDMEQNLWTNLHQKFAKSRNPLIQLTMSQVIDPVTRKPKVDENGRPIYESHVGAAYNSVNNVKKHWNDNISRGHSDARYRARDLYGFYIDLEEVKKAFPDLDTAKRHRFEFYRAIGINLSDTSELKDKLDKHDEIYDPEALYGRLEDMIEKGRVKLTDIEALVGNQYTVYTDLAELETEYSDLISTFMATTAEGTVQFEHSLHNYLSMLIHRINKVNSYQELLENPVIAHLDVRKTINGEDNPRFNPQAAASTWLRSIFNLDVPESDPKWGERVEHRGVRNTLKLVNLSGTLVKNASNWNRGTALASADIYTKFVSDVHLAFGGYYELIRSADKGTSFGVVVDGALPGTDRKDAAYVPLETFGNSRYTEKTIEKVQPHLIAELQRMWRLKQLSKKKDLTEYDFEYLDRGQKFNMFQDYFTDADKQTMQNLVDTATSLQQIEDAFRTDVKVIKAFKNSTTRYFNDQTNKNYEAFKKAGYISATVKEALANVGIKDDPKYDPDKTTKEALRFYTHNNFIHNLESTSIIYGDIAQYKHNKEELHKRDAGVNSTGLFFRTDLQMIRHINEQKYQNSYLKANAARLGIENPEETHAFNGQFRTAVIKDMNIRSKYYDAIVAKVGRKAAAKYAGYEKQTEADAQAFITFDAYRKLRITEGIWEDVHEKMFDKIVKGEKLDPKKVFKFFPVMKAQYWGPIASNHLPLTAFHKYSLCPIIPSVIEDTHLELVHDRMVKENIDYIVFESGSKISSISRDKSGKDQIYTEHTNHNELVERMNLYNTDIVPEEFKPELTDEAARKQAWKEYVNKPIFTPNVIYLDYLKDQLTIHDTNMGSTIFSTQLRKLIETGLMSHGVPTDFMPEANASVRRENWAAVKNKEDESKNYKLLKRYEGIIKQLAQIAKEKLLDELQWTQEMIDNQTGTKVTKADLTRLLTFVKQQLKTQGIAEFHLDFINEKNADLSLSFHSEQIEKMLNAVLVKRLVKQKVHGEALIQIASTLLEKSTTTAGTFRVFKPGEPIEPEKPVTVASGVEISSNATGLAAPSTESKARTTLFNPEDKTLRKGSVVQYNKGTYLFWNLNDKGRAQLITTDGQKYSGTPMPDKLQVLGGYNTTLYNGTEYIVTDHDNIYSGATGKIVYDGEDNSSKVQKERIIAQAREGLAAEPITEGPRTGKEIYKQLGEETTYEHVIIAPEDEGIFEYWKKFKKEHPSGAVLAYRGKVEFSNKTYPVFPNKFTHLKNKPELVYSGSVKQAVIDYIDWVINSDEEEAVRQRKEYQSGEHKGKSILYWKDLGEPSHATAVDYLINKYDWSAKPPVEVVPTERIGLRTTPSNDLPFYEPGPDGKTLAMKVKIPLSGDFLHLLKATHKDKKPIGTRERLNEMLKDEDWLNEGDHRQMITMTAVRIPVQNLNSMEFMEVYEFLDPGISGIVLPTEIVTKAGSDYDVDKLTVMMPSIALIGNKPELYKSGLTKKTAKELTEEREAINFELRKVHEKYDKTITDNIRDFDKEVQRRAKEYVTQIEALYEKIDEAREAKNKIHKIIKDDPTKKYRYADIRELSGEISAYFEEVRELQADLDDLVTAAKERDKELHALEAQRDQIKRELNSVSERAYHNDLISTIREILELESNYDNLIRPNSTDIYTETAVKDPKGNVIASSLSDEAAPWATDYDRFENINQAKIPHPDSKKSGKYVISPTRTMEVLYNLYKHNSNNVGKAVLGIGAVDNTYNILFNRVGAHLNYRNSKTKIRQRILVPHNEIEIDGKKCIDLGGLVDADGVNDISDVISQFINGAVDVAKDAWLFNVQGNRQITPTMMFLLQAGVPLDYIIYMVSNPLIREYVKNQQLYSSTLGALMGYEVRRGSDAQFEAQRRIIEDPIFGFPDAEEMFTVKTKSEDTIGPSSYALLRNINDKLSDIKDYQYFKKSALRDRAAAPAGSEITNFDRNVFMHFLQLEKMGSSVRDLKMRTNVDTSRNTSVFDAANRLEQLDELQEDGTFPMSLIDSLRTDSPIAPFFIQKFQVNLFGRLFPLRNHSALNHFIRENLTDEYFKSTLGSKEKGVAAFKNGLMSFIFQNEVRYFNPIGLKSYHNLPLSVTGAKGITDVDDPTVFDKIAVQHVKIEEGVRIVQGKMYVDIGSLLKQYYDGHYDVASIYTAMYGYATVDRDTFTTPSEYIHFVMEREYMRHVRPLTPELSESPEFMYQGQVIYDNMDALEGETVEEFDKRFYALTYETYLKNRALNGILNHNQLFLNKQGNTYAEQFNRLIGVYPELSKHFALINALNMSEKYTQGGAYKNLGMVDPEQDADALGVYNENLYGDMSLQYEVNSLTDEAALRRVLPEATDFQIDEIKRFFNMFPVVAFLQSGTNMRSLTSLVPLIKEETIVDFIQRPINIFKDLMDTAMQGSKTEAQSEAELEANRLIEGYLWRYTVAFYNNNTDRVQRVRGQNLSRNVSLLSKESLESNAELDPGDDLRNYIDFDKKHMDNLSYDNIIPQFRKKNGLKEDTNLYTKKDTSSAAVAQMFHDEHPDKFIVHEKANTMTRTDAGQGTFTDLSAHAIPIITSPKGDVTSPYRDIKGKANPEAIQHFEDAFLSMKKHEKDLVFAAEGYGENLIKKDKYGNYYALQTFLYLSRELYKRFGYVNPLWYEMEDYANQTQDIAEAFSRKVSDEAVDEFLKHCNI